MRVSGRCAKLRFMKQDERILELPRPIIDRLREVIARIRRLQWIKGSLLTLAAAVGCVLGVMAVDAAFSLEAMPVRVALSLTGLALTVWTAWTQWLRPLRRKISLTAVARWVETRHPELHERISTAVELLDDKHGADDQGSQELLNAVVQDAVADVGRLDPAQHLSTRRTLPARWLAGSAVALLLGLAAIWPKQVPRLLARALAPMADSGNAWAHRLRVLTASQTVAIGDPLNIGVAVRGSRERVELRMTGPDGRTLIELLTPDAGLALEDGESGYALRIPAVQEGFTARVVCGKAASAPFIIKAVPRPEPGSYTVAYHYPEYAGLPDEVKANASGEISALTGTRVTVSAPLNRLVGKASVLIGGETTAAQVTGADGGQPGVTWTTVLTPGLDAQWTLHLEDAEGIANRPVALPIRALADLPPVITLETPVEDRMELRPVEKVALTYSVTEDIGLSAVQIQIRPQDKPEYLLPAAALPIQTPGTPGEYRGSAVLDLAKVLVPDGQEIRVSLMAADRLPADLKGPQRAWSREIVIKLNRWSQPMVEKNFQAQHQELRNKMEEVKRELQHAKGPMNDKPDRLRQEETLSDNTMKDLESSTAHMQEAAALMKELTDRMKDTAYARQTPDLQNIAEAMLQPAQEKTRNIPLTDQKEARSQLAENSRDLLEQAIQKMEQQQQQMDQDRETVQQAAQLSDIAEQQQRLASTANTAAAAPPEASASPPAQAKAPDAATQPPPAPADPSAQAAAPAAPTDAQQREWLEEQRRIAERAKQLMEQSRNANPDAMQAQLKQAAHQAAELAAAAEALGAREKGLAAEMPAAPTPEARQQSAAAQQQMAGEVAALQQKAREFQQATAKQIDQSSETQEASYQASGSLEEASALAKQSSEQMAQAAAATPAKAEANATAHQPADAPAKAPANSPADQSASPAAQANAAPGAPPPPAASSEGQPPASSAPGSPANNPPTGQQAAQAAQDSAQALAEAAESLKMLGQELNSLAGMVAEHNKSLGEGAQQAGTAAEQAVKPQNEQGKSPSMQQGAAAAQQAADQLAVAANTVMQAMSIPASAKASKPAPPSKGQGKPQDGQPKPDSPPGQEGKDGLQMDTASSALPAELAKLGLTLDDWMKLRSSLNGVDGVRTEQIPAEYRDLVKAYFGALATGGKTIK
jgi:hypothetical protein